MKVYSTQFKLTVAVTVPPIYRYNTNNHNYHLHNYHNGNLHNNYKTAAIAITFFVKLVVRPVLILLCPLMREDVLKEKSITSKRKPKRQPKISNKLMDDGFVRCKISASKLSYSYGQAVWMFIYSKMCTYISTLNIDRLVSNWIDVSAYLGS